MAVVARARLKICGVTHPDDVDACREHGVDAIGLNLWPGSKRAVTLEHARSLAEHARAGGGGPSVVGVFVDPTLDELRRAAQALGLDAIQLHGDASPEPYAALGWPWLWVVRGTPSLASLRVPAPTPAWILLDANVPGFGGRGVTTDWAWAAAAVRHLAPAAVWLAGGITPSNAAAALAQVRPAGLDVASGAEREGEPRRKDSAKIAALAAICNNPPAP
ncbi:MAG: phosphoribosylanthranilate isomerase [Myxococcales bacterium]|nr:phosphoribosylanthranilate isomerase [Myxococcales bacterium]